MGLWRGWQRQGGLGSQCLLTSGPQFLLVPVLWGGSLHALTDFQLHLWPVAGLYLLVCVLAVQGLAKVEGRKSSHDNSRQPDREAEACPESSPQSKNWILVSAAGLLVRPNLHRKGDP